MKIYRLIKIDIGTGEILEEHSYKYQGPLALCDGGEAEGSRGFADPFGGKTSFGAEDPDLHGIGVGPELGRAMGREAAGVGPDYEGVSDPGLEAPETLEGYAATKGRAIERTGAPKPVSWSDVGTAALRAATLGMIVAGPPGALLAGTIGGLVSHELQAGTLNLGEPTPSATADTGQAGAESEGQRATSRVARSVLTEGEPGGLLDTGAPLDEEEETLGRGRRATQTLLTGGRGLLAPARTRRRTLLAA